jgi:hypothetical protein
MLAGIHANVPPEATVRLQFAPAEAAQVDFGAGPVLLDPARGELRRTWAFVMGSKLFMKPKKPAISPFAISALTLLTGAQRTPDPREQAALSIQEPARRHEEQDDAHNEVPTEASWAQGYEQAPPPAPQLPPGRFQDWSTTQCDDAHWWAAVQAAMNTTMHRNAALLDSAQSVPPTCTTSSI